MFFMCLYLFLLCFAYIKWRYFYWKSRNIPSIKDSFLFGNLEPVITGKEAAHATISKFYQSMKAQGCTHAGFYASIIPFYIPISNNLIGHVLTKSYKHFYNRGFYHNETADPLSAHIFTLDGDNWKNCRARLSAAYTLAKIKITIETQLICAMNLERKITNLWVRKIPIDLQEMCFIYSMDLIASCAFGLNIQTLDDPNDYFRKHAFLALGDYEASFKFGFCYMFKNWAKFFKLRFINRRVSEYFKDLSEKTVKYRERTGCRRNDLLQILIDLKNNGGISSCELSAESYAFFVAGFNTTSLTISYCLYEIAKNCKIQEKVKEEISSVLAKYDGAICFDGLVEMVYLQQVIDETLRMYPPVPVFLRECTQDFPIPDTDIILDKGTRVVVPVYGIHHDPEYFREPEVFDPDRFSKENRHTILPYTYMPFGEGPRICIALKFATLQIKLGVIAFLRNNSIKLNRNTPAKIKMAVNSLFLYSEDEIFLDPA